MTQLPNKNNRMLAISIVTIYTIGNIHITNLHSTNVMGGREVC